MVLGKPVVKIACGWHWSMTVWNATETFGSADTELYRVRRNDVVAVGLQPARRVIKLSNYRASLLTRSRPRHLLRDVSVDVDFYATRQIGAACTTEHTDGTFNTERGRDIDTVAVSVQGAQSL